MVVAAVIDGGLAALMVAVSGFFFGGGAESMHGGGLLMAAYVAAVLGCLAAPVIAFILNRNGKPGIGLAVAWLPPIVALVASMVPLPY
jgi:hypothetical protein